MNKVKHHVSCLCKDCALEILNEKVNKMKEKHLENSIDVKKILEDE